MNNSEISKLIFFVLLFFSGAFIFTALKSLVYAGKFLSYLKKNNHDRWRELTTVLGMPGGNNSIRFMKYLYSDKDDEDLKIKEQKQQIKKCYLHSLISTISLIVCVAVIFVITIILF